FLYFCDGYNIGRANLDGSGQTTLVSGLTDGPVGPVLDLAGGQMYWTNVFAGTIQRANLDGSGLTTLVSGLNAPGFPALDLVGRTIYWPEGGSQGAIRRANLDGTGVVTLVSGLDQPLLSLWTLPAAECTGQITAGTSSGPTSTARARSPS